MSATAADAAERRNTYDRVIRVVRYNTWNDYQGPTIASHTVVQIATRYGHHDDTDTAPDRVRAALRAGPQNEDLVRVNDRYCLADRVRTLDGVLEAAEREARTRVPYRPFVAWCNRRAGALRGETA